jgi:hypothetical protein
MTTHARQTRQKPSAHPTRVSHAAGAASRVHHHADVVHMMRTSRARHSSSKCDVKRAGNAHHARWTRRGELQRLNVLEARM